VKRLLLILATALLLTGALSNPTILKADGGPGPNCSPDGRMCKP
jgi:hypothetical protein